MNARLNLPNNNLIISPIAISKSQIVNYNMAWTKKNLTAAPQLLNSTDQDQNEDMNAPLSGMEKVVKIRGMANNCNFCFKHILQDHIDIFRTSFSSGRWTRQLLLKIELTIDAKPVKIRLQKYSQKQQGFMMKILDVFVLHEIAHPDLTLKYSRSLLLVPNYGGPFQFKINIRPVNVFRIMYNSQMPSLKNELSKLKQSL